MSLKKHFLNVYFEMLKSVSNETFNKCFFMVSKETFQNKRFKNILKMFNLKRFF